MNATEIKKFEVGKTYTMRSICDYNCIWTYTIKSRTASTITTECGKTLRIIKKLTEWNGSESVRPDGSYSMSPVLKA
jgi:hypothetical protein